LDGACVGIQDEETLGSGERQDRGRCQALFKVLEGLHLGGVQRREHVREFGAGELGQRFGDVRVILNDAPVHVAHAQEALELRVVEREEHLRQALDVLLVPPQPSGAYDLPQVLEFLMEQVALGGLE